MDDGFPIVVVLGLAVFGMIWVGTEAGDGFNLGGSDAESMILLSENPGTIGQSNEDFRTTKFGSFTVGEARGNVQAYTAEDFRLSNGLFSGDKITVNYDATQPGQGQVSFEVLGREAKGEIFVKVNGNQVFSAATVSGATPEINISKRHFKNGENKVVIGTTQPNPLKKAVYSIEDIEVTVEDRKFHDYTGYFQMYQHELDSFRPSNLTFQVPLDQSVPQKPLEIQINNQEIFNQKLGRSTQQVTVTPQNADLSTGYNTIKFSTDGESYYRIQNAELQTRYSVNVKPAQTNFEFNLDEETLNYAQRDNTKEELRFQYQKTTTAEPIQLQINNQYQQIKPENGFNTVEINSDALQRENTLTLNSNQTFTVDDMQIISEKEE
ncbi:hypothetical protein [Candidatus Nanohalobium constans]|uniref:Uncharacterized protein n=1 Tax=Candidatus Nanohalobium constans TaxID=2565781 RepID=A0A5Q0UGL8_9ARCH|nr:hypothetical protein [Candidatus Nanohalobium constans]QGA80793.1 hypothetical protein LC1Nh_0911 [Candidatus Nanohalobium constans]